MDRSKTWPAFRGAWILHEDDALVVVDKPVGVPSQASAPGDAFDVVTRLGAYLEARGDADPYLGVHQRLDRETSGVLLYTRRRDVNAAVAAQMEGRTVDKRYWAVVTGWQGGPRVLRHRLRRASVGRMEVARAGKLAVMRTTPLERREGRTLLEVELETGRTHQIRVQLAHEGSPVAGDVLYGGVTAPRLMLHARSLGLIHPVTGAKLRVESPVPGTLDRFLRDGLPAATFSDPEAWADALRRAVERRYALGHAAELPEPTTAFRLVYGAGDALPGLDVDVYGDHLAVHRTDDPEPNDEALLDALAGLGFDGIYLKRRPRQANVVVDARGTELAPAGPVRGVAAPDPLTIFENGLPFEVRLGDGLSTGLFLDQRDNRRRVRDMAGGARVLNLFCYTGGFTVAAAAGGAASTLSVDAAAPALERARRNLEVAGLAGPAHELRRADAFGVLEDLARKGATFDLVIVDPPTYSRTRRRRWTSGTGFRGLLAQGMAVLAPGGTLLASSNDRRLPLPKFRRYAHEAAREVGRRIAKMRDLPPPADHPVPPGGAAAQKSILVTLA